MANPRIRSKRSSVEGKVPAASQLMRGEFAVNSYDGKVYILKDQTSVGIATTTVTVNPWEEPNGVGAGVSYSSDVNVLGVVTATSFVGDVTGDVTGIATGSTRVLVDESEDDNHYYNILFTDVSPGAGNRYYTLQVDNLGLRFNPGTNVFEVQKVEAYNYVASQAYYDIDNAGSSYNFDSNGDAGILTNGTPNLVVGVDGNTRVTNSLNVSGIVTTTGLTVGNYSFPSTAGAEGLVLKVDGSGDLTFGSGSAGGVEPTEETFTATEGQTVFTASSTLPTYIQVFINGVKTRPTTDFTKSGANVTLVSAATAGDHIDIVRFD